ncbi:dipeptidase [Consotaella salsifontis]|uniref:Acetylornithine deacetylase/Succinyl-diaminopimelate desuccinylase n=1 Tax=Consotaella salsifontis TaxID=1365950 RepID=A0A1T4Q0V1_9HYPH|nr:dipeptidase [Consotaella salsifontis]SJZ97413.1 Acetylornithine deacetylase/Succinyl-diaminopimelate desuccinylase [Consotaella salsifontis]
MTATVEAHLAAHAAESLRELEAFCAIASVSTDPAYKAGIREAAEFVADALRRSGLPTVELIETAGHPGVFAQGPEIAGAPTVLVYGHYDVQPPDPLDKWQTPPFEPTVREDRLYARGVSDDKGPLLIPILVARAYRDCRKDLPVNLKFLIEGEEETGSPHFESMVAANAERFGCDLVISADGAMWRPDLPSVTVAGRGLVALDVILHGAAKDLHSGRHGGSAPNAVRALIGMLATLHDDDGNVLVEGFADDALPPDPAVVKAIQGLGFDTGRYFEEIGAPAPEPMPGGEDLLTRQWLIPTLELNGVTGGYSGHGTKTVIPATASAKITCRLVRGQDPDRVFDSIVAHLERVKPSGYRLDFVDHRPGTSAFSIDPDLPALAIVQDVLQDLLGARPIRVAMGATIPIGSVFEKHLEVGTVFFSFSTSDEDYHAPNEFLRLSNFRLGMTAWVRLLERLGGR